MDSLEAFILAGGASSRMGTNKSKLLIGKQSFIARIASAVRPLARRITVVGPLANDLPQDVWAAADVYKSWGALGGVHAALSNCKSEWAAVIACDLPFVTTALFQRLLALT